MNYQTVIILVFILSSCNTQLVKFYDGNENYKPLFNKKKIKPLKEEWKELYLYLQSGHVLQKKEERAVTYIYSYELYKYLHKNMKKIHHTSYLSKYQNMVDVFGEPDAVFEDKRYINLNYMVHIVDDPCETCTHSGFSFLFDKTTKIIDGYVDKEDEKFCKIKSLINAPSFIKEGVFFSQKPKANKQQTIACQPSLTTKDLKLSL